MPSSPDRHGSWPSLAAGAAAAALCGVSLGVGLVEWRTQAAPPPAELAPAYRMPRQFEGPFDEGPPGLTSAEIIARSRQREQDMALIADHRLPAPGRRHLLAVWTDPAAAEAFRSQAVPDLPRGTLVLNGRLRTGWTIALLKREPGYNPAAGDWEFLEFDQDEGVMFQRGRIATCLACHGQRPERGNLFRIYLPAFADTPVPVPGR